MTFVFIWPHGVSLLLDGHEASGIAGFFDAFHQILGFDYRAAVLSLGWRPMMPPFLINCLSGSK